MYRLFVSIIFIFIAGCGTTKPHHLSKNISNINYFDKKNLSNRDFGRVDIHIRALKNKDHCFSRGNSPKTIFDKEDKIVLAYKYRGWIYEYGIDSDYYAREIHSKKDEKQYSKQRIKMSLCNDGKGFCGRTISGKIVRTQKCTKRSFFTVEYADYSKDYNQFTNSISDHRIDDALVQGESLPNEFFDSNFYDLVSKSVESTRDVAQVDALAGVFSKFSSDRTLKRKLNKKIKDKKDDINYKNIIDLINKNDHKSAITILEKNKHLGKQIYHQISDMVKEANTVDSLVTLERIVMKIPGNRKLLRTVRRKKNKTIFYANFNYNITSASESELKKFLSNKSVLSGGNKKDIIKLKNRANKLADINESIRRKKERDSILSSNNINTVKDYYNKNTSDNDVFNHLISLYRGLGSFLGYLSSYDLTRSRSDILEASKRANSYEDKKTLEYKILESFDAASFVNVSFIDGYESELKKSTQRGFGISFKGMVRDYNRKIKVSLDKSKGLNFTYGQYKVKIRSKLMLHYSPPIRGKGKDFNIRDMEVVLSPKNNYSAIIDVSHQRVAVHGEYRHIATKALGFIAGLFGAKDYDRDVYFPIKLNSTELTSEVISAKGI